MSMSDSAATIEASAPRQFAVEVVKMLREAGFQALWAGGCVRDQLLGKPPKDYDVATDATPDQVRHVFGRRRTLAIGAAFGVITVLGPPGAGQIEIATFRRDLGYSDGRRPDQVEFSTAAEDAQRRDFTINGLFYDPLREQVIDYVGGQQDLRDGILRAIGVPQERFTEDKLRMLRAVRFTAALGFHLDEATLAAVRIQANEILIVSPERIAAEMRRMLEHAARAQALQLLHATGLLRVLLPESELLTGAVEPTESPDHAAWRATNEILRRLPAPGFYEALAAFVRKMRPQDVEPTLFAELLADRWKLTNEERDGVAWLLDREELICTATEVPWPRLQRTLAAPRASELLAYCEAITAVECGRTTAVDYCRERISRPREVWDPPPFITGGDLIAIGLKPGPQFKLVLEHVRDAQLLGEVTTSAEALGLARSFAAGHPG